MTKETYRADIMGLRAIAILAVATLHEFPTIVPGGSKGSARELYR
jgi:peptidoglycan/LPS O-acetylase OafA/YrhL